MLFHEQKYFYHVGESRLEGIIFSDDDGHIGGGSRSGGCNVDHALVIVMVRIVVMVVEVRIEVVVIV